MGRLPDNPPPVKTAAVGLLIEYAIHLQGLGLIRIERAGAAPIPEQGTVPGEESARPGEVQRLLDVIAWVRVLPGERRGEERC